MDQAKLTELFDQQAANYDQQWAKMAPLREALLYLLESQFADLPDDAKVLCVGVGTGAEMAHLASRHPRWQFTAVEPSGQMLEVCRARMQQQGFADRSTYHHGFLDSLPKTPQYDAATCFLVSQFILDPAARTQFFGEIATRLTPGGRLASSDLSCDTSSHDYQVLLNAWMKMMADAELTDEMRDRMQQAYANDVAIVPPNQVAALIQSAGFESAVQFYQTGLIHGWISRVAG
ncbi:class I SAM-dependent methyltransferase [Aeoliella mucimassa]|uniref:Ubiquinone/menaquinone biosynthesis methyltransferase n=1 Tax=Aeoliella mucimassa TaxID=2527972 RepID=A0A518AH30_9BACT|nr:class I SAM-dependent methyltransferase [Aeoliella mucimassa]QDU54040.1 ubiquinone/menaquinone biosynthesis methyltransferase [Aeoliella mucimassa]